MNDINGTEFLNSETSLDKRMAFELHYPMDHLRGMVEYMQIIFSKVSAVNCEIIDKVLEQEDFDIKGNNFISEENEKHSKFHWCLTIWKLLCGLLGNFYLTWLLILVSYLINII